MKKSKEIFFQFLLVSESMNLNHLLKTTSAGGFRRKVINQKRSEEND
jgi:hypothetical protein